jgi:Protein of unknown function (DUF2934)
MNAAANPKPWPNSLQDLQQAIRRRAEEIYIRNGRIPGRDLDNWAQAEREILRESAQGRTRKTAIVLRVSGTEYIGEYNPESSDGYRPGEFGLGAFVPVRFHGDKMFVKRSNGRILETTIVKIR